MVTRNRPVPRAFFFCASPSGGELSLLRSYPIEGEVPKLEMNIFYPLVINIDPENSLVLMETNLPTPIRQGPC